MRYKQYSVVIVNLNPPVGSEIQKTRPCLVISPDEMNYANIIVAPMTSKKKDYPTRVQLKGLKMDSFVVLDQIWTISVQRVVKVTDSKISKKKIDEVKKIIKTMLVD